MNTNAALIVPPTHAASSNAAVPAFAERAKPLIDIPAGWLWLIYVVLALLAMAAIWWGWQYWRKRAVAKPAERLVLPHERARQLLEQALALLGEPKPFTIMVSSTIRVYLEERFNFRAPERTTEEFLYELKSTNLLTPDQKQSLGDFLASCDLIKFAKYEPTEVELRALHDAALRLVNETEPSFVTTDIGATTAPQTPVGEITPVDNKWT